MKHLLITPFALLLLAGATFAGGGDCTGREKVACEKAACDQSKCGESGDCTKCSSPETTAEAAPAAATIDMSAAIAKLDASSAKGCLTSRGKLVMLRKACGADDVATLKEKVAAYEKYGAKGCTVSNRMLARMQTAIEKPAVEKPAVEKAPLSERVTHYRVTALKPLFDASGMKDADTLVAYVRNLEAKGCGSCKEKIAELDALLAEATPKLSLRVAKLAEGRNAGCEESAAKLKMLESSCGADCSKSLVGEIAAWETKADKGCQACETKLAGLEMKLATATAKSSCGPKGAKGKDCSDSGSGCDRAAKTAGGTAATTKAACDKAAGDCGGCPSKKEKTAEVTG